MACTFRSRRVTGLCTSDVVYQAAGNVHHLYMPSNKSRKSKGKSPPRITWRLTNIRLHRESAIPKVTQQMVADFLAEKGITYDRVSIARVEKGLQRPPDAVLDAMAEMFGVDVPTLLDGRPGEGADILAFKSLPPEERARIMNMYRIMKGETDGA